MSGVALFGRWNAIVPGLDSLILQLAASQQCIRGISWGERVGMPHFFALLPGLCRNPSR